jgi:hypothetical protein
MLALAIEFSRCSRARTLKAEQCVGPDDPGVRGGGRGIGTIGRCIDLESAG